MDITDLMERAHDEFEQGKRAEENGRPEPAKHNHDPLPFGRRVKGCPRCDELAAGAAPKAGWGDLKKENDRRRAEDIRQHDCIKAGCGPVCTFGEW